MKVELRAVTSDDEAFLAELDGERHAGELAVAGLPPEAFKQLLAMQHRARTMGYASQFPHAENSIVWIGPHRVGRVLVNVSHDELRLVDIALLTAYRGGGIGTGLLKELIARARTAKLPLRLSVSTGNPAARLYARLGFAVTAADAMYAHMEIRQTGSTVSAPQAEAPGSAERVPPATSSAYFRWLTGKPVEGRSLDGASIDLVVTRVTTPLAVQSQVESNDSFTATLKGPLFPLLSQELCELREPGTGSEQRGEPLLVALVPLGPKEGSMEYEAVFNRMQWKAAAP